MPGYAPPHPNVRATHGGLRACFDARRVCVRGPRGIGRSGPRNARHARNTNETPPVVPRQDRREPPALPGLNETGLAERRHVSGRRRNGESARLRQLAHRDALILLARAGGAVGGSGRRGHDQEGLRCSYPWKTHRNFLVSHRRPNRFHTIRSSVNTLIVSTRFHEALGPLLSKLRFSINGPHRMRQARSPPFRPRKDGSEVNESVPGVVS